MINKLQIVFLLFFSYFFDIVFCEGFCCCLFSKDPFRGFHSTSSDIIAIGKEDLEKGDLATKLLKICQDQMGGFPSSENLTRMHKNVFDCSKKECEKECAFLMKELNEKYNIKQQENRMSHAKALKEKKKSLLKLFDNKITENTVNFYKGVGCKVSIKTKTKGLTFINKLPPNNAEKILEILRSNEISFDSATNNSDSEFYQNTDNQSDFLNNNIITSSNNELISEASDSGVLYNEMSDVDLERELDALDNEIMFLEKKNKKPIDYILDRFGTQDEILIKIIKVFQSAMKEVLNNVKEYYEETIYFRFRISENLKKGLKKTDIFNI